MQSVPRLVAAALILLAPVLSSAAIKLTDRVIVIPSDATPAERTAAAELADYLHQITGDSLPIQTEASDKNVILVGPSKRARALLPEVNFDDLAPDSILIRTRKDTLILAGPRPRGTLYAVYHFLENTLGVRWWTSSESTVPKSTALEIPELDISYAPPLRYREVYNEDVIGQNSLFAARMKLNGHMTEIPPNLGGHYTILGWCHTFFRWLPPARYFAGHPDWYALVKNKRIASGQLCLSNDEMRQEMVRVVLRQIRKHPDAGIISVSQNDWLGACECDKCKAIIKEEGSQAGPLIRFVNAVAADVAKEYPDFLFETLAYQFTRTPPKKVRPAKNVLVRLCSIECDFTHPLDSSSNKKFGDDLREWGKIAPNLFVWNYVTDFGNYLIPHPNYAPLGADLRFFVDNHVIGVFEQGDAYNILAGDMLPLRTWVLAHLCWDPQRDQKELTTEFLAGYYGPAVAQMQQYMDLINAPRPGYTRGCMSGDISIISDDTFAKMTRLFDDANNAAAHDPAIQKRLRRARLVLDHLRLIRWPFAPKLAQAKAANLSPQTVVDEYDRAAHEFVNSARALGVTSISEGQDFDSYARATLARGEQFAPIDLPKAGAALPPNQLDIQEDRFQLHGKGDWSEIVSDPKASNQKAARMPGGHSQWAIQFHIPPDLAKKGPWKCYLLIRCDAKKKQGTAFWYGLHDNPHGQFIVRTPVACAAADGEYHPYLIPVDALREGQYFWVSPAGNPNVDHVYVDRIFLIHQP